MSEPLIVTTYFGDVAEFTEGFADRVEEGQIILYGPVVYEEGDRITFQVLLAEGEVALEGAASVMQCADGGEDRDPDSRIDIYLAGLDLAGASEVIFERLLSFKRGEVSTSVALPEPEAEAEEVVAPPSNELAVLDSVTEVLDSPLEAEEPEPEPAPAPAARPAYRSVAPEPIVGGGKNAGMVAGSRGLPPPSPPRPPTGFTVALGLTGQLGRQVMEAAWTPEPPPREPSTEPTGHFAYGAAVPIPPRPPRPELDPGRTIDPAPAATSEATYRSAREALGYRLPTASDAPPPLAHASAPQAYAPEADVSEEAFDVGDEAFDMDAGES